MPPRAGRAGAATAPREFFFIWSGSRNQIPGRLVKRGKECKGHSECTANCAARVDVYVVERPQKGGGDRANNGPTEVGALWVSLQHAGSSVIEDVLD
ncbi:hypothetical protein MTO96_021323 [Rhipicephalus appendiculatus]